MWLTTSQRVRLLIRDLVLQPSFVPAYLAHLPFWGKSPLDLRKPWWSYASIRRCRTLIGPESRVFEFGTGGSTIFLASRVQSVTCVEDSLAWARAVEAKLAELDIKNCTIHRADLPSRDENDPKWQSYLGFLEGSYDLIIVDGQDTHELGFRSPGVMRNKCFYHSERFIRPGGAIIVDDSWRYPHLRTTSHAKKVETFASVGPCRYGVTSTDVYFY